MESVPVIILIDQNTIVKSRVKNIFENLEVKIYEAHSRQDVMKIMSMNNNNLDLIVSEIEIDPASGFDGIALIKFIKMKRSSIPVVILSSIGRRDVITRCLIEGAADYILKPFEDEYLKEKLMKYLNIESLSEVTTVKFNLKEYLDSEIYKARKGKYPFSLVMVKFDSSTTNDLDLSHYSFYNYSELLYNELKSLFWDSDLYIQHGFHSHLGIFPFCSNENTSTIIKKIDTKFNQIKQKEPHLSNYTITIVSSTFPYDGECSNSLLSTLSNSQKYEEMANEL